MNIIGDYISIQPFTTEYWASLGINLSIQIADFLVTAVVTEITRSSSIKSPEV